MDSGIWASWYDLPVDGKADYLSWLHETHLPMLMSMPGVAWAAHYQITGGGTAMDKIQDTVARPNDDSVGTGTQYLLLMGAPSPQVFFTRDMTHRIRGADHQARDMLDVRMGARTCIFTEQARVDGPESDHRPLGTTPGPAIQMGSFRTKTLDDEFDIGAWYVQYRLPAMARMKGSIGTRKLVSVAGWAKHSILYEFTSLQAREDHFLGHESLGLDETEWTGRVIRYTIHAPGSPSVARRIWPEI